jgi:hypothetical protein
LDDFLPIKKVSDGDAISNRAARALMSFIVAASGGDPVY